ncbi:MAG: G8 domain-containing protein, partial [Dehalococcoidia bacterium]
MKRVGASLLLLILLTASLLFLPPDSLNPSRSTQAASTIFSVQTGNWSNPSIWNLGRTPQTGDDVIISPWTTITYDVASDQVLGQVIVDGTLTFSRAVDTRMKVADHIVVGFHAPDALVSLDGGFLDLGTPADPIPAGVDAEIIFVLPQGYVFSGGPTPQAPDVGLWAAGGRWEVHGAPLTRTWSKLADDALASTDPATVVVENNVIDWPIGGEVVVTQTSNPYRPDTNCNLDDACSYHWENEVRAITTLSSLPGGRTLVTLDQPLEFDHQGTGQTRGEVGLLSRNVLIRTEITGVADATLDQQTSERRFAHTMLMGGTQGS